MRQLNSLELKEKFGDYSRDIIYCDINELTVKLNQFIYFLNDQAISKRILERIEEEFQSLKTDFNVGKHQRSYKYYKDVLEKIYSREDQGALGYFYILEKYQVNPKYRTHYIDDIRNWYDGGRDYNDEKRKLNTYFFEPFIELFDWFLRESETISPNDYFSEETRQDIIARLNLLEDNLNQRMDIGNQVVFEEVEEVKELITFLNKKNWLEVIKGKFADLALTGIISKEVANSIVESIIGYKIDLFQ